MSAAHPIDPAQLCGTNFSYMRFPLERWLDDMIELEVGNVELWGVSPHLYVDDAGPRDVERVRRAIVDRGLTLTCFTPEQVMYPINIAARDETVRTRSVDYFFRCIDVCVALECPLLLVTAGWGYVDEDAAEVWRRSAASLASIVDRAQTHGLTAVLEALQPTESQVVNTSADLERMLREIASPALRIAIDTAAMAVAGESVADYYRVLGPQVGHAHFVDGTPAGHLAWGDGNLPLERYVRELGAGGYTGYLSFELISQRYWLEPKRPLRQSIAQVAAAIATLDSTDSGAVPRENWRV